MNKQYYIQDTHTINGDLAMFWKANGYGKTYKLSEAGLFSLEYINKLQENDQNEQLVAVSKTYIDKVKESVVLLEGLRK